MNLNRRLSVLIASLPFLLVLQGCPSSEIGNASDVNPESIYFDYSISGEDGMEDVTIRLQYRFAGPDGTTLVLQPPAAVKLDGVELRVDSSKIGGAYYQASMPASSFGGKHNIEYRDINNKIYKESFEFPVFSLQKDLGDTLKAADADLRLSRAMNGSIVELMITDTSVHNEAYQKVDTIKGDIIHLEGSGLRKLKKGPVQLLLTLDKDTPVKNGTKEGGRLRKSYSLRREFFLQ